MNEWDVVRNVHIKGQDLAGFQNNWDVTLSQMIQRPRDIHLEGLYIKQLRKCDAMRQELMWYDHYAWETDQHGFEWLHQKVEQYLARTRRKWVSNNYFTSASGHQHTAAGADSCQTRGNGPRRQRLAFALTKCIKSDRYLSKRVTKTSNELLTSTQQRVFTGREIYRMMVRYSST